MLAEESLMISVLVTLLSVVSCRRSYSRLAVFVSADRLTVVLAPLLKITVIVALALQEAASVLHSAMPV